MMGRSSMGSQLSGNRDRKDKAMLRGFGSSETARTLASKARGRKRYGVDSRYEDRGTSGKNEARKEKQSIEKEYNKDKELIKKYGKDAMKAKGFAKTTDAERVSRFSYGGKVTKMSPGGKITRGDGCCNRGKTKGTMR